MPKSEVGSAIGAARKPTLDRLFADANWAMVDKRWKIHVLGEGQLFAYATAAVNGLREQNPGTIDQDLPPFVIGENSRPLLPDLSGQDDGQDDSVVWRRALAPAISGWLAIRLGSYNLGLYLAFAVMLVGNVLLVILKDVDKHDAAALALAA